MTTESVESLAALNSMNISESRPLDDNDRRGRYQVRGGDATDPFGFSHMQLFL